MISRTIQSDLTNEVVILLRTVWFLIVASLLFSSGSSQAGTIPFFDTANRPGNINVGTAIETSQNGYWKVTAGSYYAGTQRSESVYVYNDDSLIKLSYLTSGVTFTVEQITPTKIDSVLRPANMNPGTILLATSGDVWKIVTGSYYGGSAQQEQVVIYIAGGKTYMSFDTSGVVMEVLLLSSATGGGGDFNGDGSTDIAAFHLPSDQFFTDYAGNLGQYGWGGADCYPIIWDYNGDGKTEVSIYHIPTNQWFVKGITWVSSVGVAMNPFPSPETTTVMVS
jgi:hypothetical protein